MGYSRGNNYRASVVCSSELFIYLASSSNFIWPFIEIWHILSSIVYFLLGNVSVSLLPLIQGCWMKGCKVSFCFLFPSLENLRRFYCIMLISFPCKMFVLSSNIFETSEALCFISLPQTDHYNPAWWNEDRIRNISQ